MSLCPALLAAVALGLGGLTTPARLAAADPDGVGPPSCDPPGTRYYLMMFGGQSVPFVPRMAHTWATWVKATPMANGAVALDVVTISWLPADLEVNPGRLRAKVGRNRTLDETLAIMAGYHARVSVWGPYETDADRFDRAAEQARLLESGAVRFRTFDSLTRRRDVSHCAHAVTYADPVARKYVQPVLRVGEPGTSRLAGRYLRNGAFPGYPDRQDWLLAALGVDRYGVVRREPGERIPREWR
ncbi:MAG: hypothetical protein K2X87_15475 [Gemmataceae bacterium]|nr:hypothetical protein [Gemmataceae bacterium]